MEGTRRAVKMGNWCFSFLFLVQRVPGHIVFMFPHFNLTRRPVYTYRRKTKLEFISDSSDDDSDLEDQKHQQRRPTMVKVHEEGASLFAAGQTGGAIEDKSFHIKSAKASANDIRNQKQPEEHVTPTATMVN